MVHFTAMDEHRYNFALTKLPGATEKQFPGVHCDIGGAYLTEKETVDEMNNYYQRMYTPKVKKTLHCRSCSLADICLPEMKKTESAKLYVEKRLNE